MKEKFNDFIGTRRGAIMRLFIVLTLLIPTLANSECTTKQSDTRISSVLEIKTDVPSHLKGAVIIVRLAGGTESQVPAEKFKVVKRKQEFVVTEVERNNVTTCDAPNKRNRVSAFAGHGARNGVDSTQVSSSLVEVENRRGAIGSVQYQRLLNDTVSVGVQGQTNSTVSVGVGVDF